MTEQRVEEIRARGCELCGEPSDHRHKDGGYCCVTCCSFWGGLSDQEDLHAWVERIFTNAIKRRVALDRVTAERDKLQKDYDYLLVKMTDARDAILARASARDAEAKLAAPAAQQEKR